MLELCRCPNIYGPDCMTSATALDGINWKKKDLIKQLHKQHHQLHSLPD